MSGSRFPEFPTEVATILEQLQEVYVSLKDDPGIQKETFHGNEVQLKAFLGTLEATRRCLFAIKLALNRDGSRQCLAASQYLISAISLLHGVLGRQKSLYDNGKAFIGAAFFVAGLAALLTVAMAPVAGCIVAGLLMAIGQ